MSLSKSPKIVSVKNRLGFNGIWAIILTIQMSKEGTQ